MSRFATLLVGCALFAAAPAAAQVYRWVDEAGAVHYSDVPPAGVAAEALPIDTTDTDLEAALRATVERERRLELSRTLEADAAEDAAIAQAEAAALARSCEQARERVARIESARRLSRVGADGARHTYTDSERASALAEARRQVEEWCR